MDENLVNFFNNSGDGFLMEELMSDESENNEITSATPKLRAAKHPSRKKFRGSNPDDDNEESNDTEYPSCSKERKRRIVWSKYAERLLLELWEKNAVELRSVRKNAHIYSKIANQLKTKSDHKFSNSEVKTKIQNMHSKYIDERKKIDLSGGTPSTWVHYFKVHSILGSRTSFNLTPLDKGQTEGEYQDTNSYNSDYEFSSEPIKSEPKKKNKVAEQHEKLKRASMTTKSNAAKQLAIKEKENLNSENQTALIEEDLLMDEFLSDGSESSEITESADEGSNESEDQNCSKQRKRRIAWSENAVGRLLEVWEKKIDELRSARKNAHIYREIAGQLSTNGHTFSGNEIKTKIQNLHAKYIEEKKKMDSSDTFPSTWIYYSKVHSILERHNLALLVKENSGEYKDFNPYSSDHELPSASMRPEPRKKKKVMDQQEELLHALQTANSIAEKQLVLKEKDILNSEKQTELIDQQIEILQGIATCTAQFQVNILKLLKKK